MLIALELLALVACDRFFVLEVQVTECGSREPLAGVSARLKLDKGIGEEDRFTTSDADGRLSLTMNEPPNAWATLVLEASGYEAWSRQFQGAPRELVTVCLEAAKRAGKAARVSGRSGPTSRSSGRGLSLRPATEHT